MVKYLNDFYHRKKVNFDRQINLDVFKVFATIFMIMCHVVMDLAICLPNFESDWQFKFADDVLGAYLFVAHGFMLVMGIGMIYSNHSTPKEMLIRGIKLFLIGTVLNLLRSSIYIPFLEEVEDKLGEFFYYSFELDILQFAGVAFMLTALLK